CRTWPLTDHRLVPDTMAPTGAEGGRVMQGRTSALNAGRAWRRPQGLMVFTIAWSVIALAFSAPHPALAAPPAMGVVATGKIAFDSNRTGNYDIFTIEADGTGLTQLTHKDAADYSPAWSPDGTTIAFVSDRAGS